MVAKAPNFEGAVPVEIHLTPIQEFCDKTESIALSIAESNIDAVSTMLANMELLESRVRTLLATSIAITYPSVKTNLNIYKTKLKAKGFEIKKVLKDVLPAIKSGSSNKSEHDLINLLAEVDSSPFNFIKSEMFLTNRSREIKAIKELMADFSSISKKNFAIADFREPTKARLMLNYEKVLIFSVNILQTETVTETFLSGSKESDLHFWYDDVSKASTLGLQRKLFKNFVNTNLAKKDISYLIEINSRDNNKPVELKAINRGKSWRNFQIPEIPEKPILVGTTFDNFKIELKKPNNTWIEKIIIEYWRFIDGEKGKTSKEFNVKTLNVTISNLQPSTKYQYRVIHYTRFGVSPSSETSDVTTTPCSPPTNIRIVKATKDSLTFSWNAPLEIGKGFKINKYTATLKGIFN